MSGEEAKPEDQRERSQRALKIFLDAQSRVTASSEKAAAASAKLISAIGDDNQGLVAALADLIDELAAHRKEMRELRAAFLKAGGVNVDLGSILGGGRKRG
jgi:hypothetical protein